METTVIILWVYIALLIAGGLMGFIKAKSKASIIASTVFAIPLILVAVEVEVIPETAADILLAGLKIMFGAKYFRSWKFMPGGMMGIASLVAFVLRLLLQSPTP